MVVISPAIRREIRRTLNSKPADKTPKDNVPSAPSKNALSNSSPKDPFLTVQEKDVELCKLILATFVSVCKRPSRPWAQTEEPSASSSSPEAKFYQLNREQLPEPGELDPVPFDKLDWDEQRETLIGEVTRLVEWEKKWEAWRKQPVEIDLKEFKEKFGAVSASLEIVANAMACILGDSSDYKDEIVRIKAMARQHDRDTDIYGSLESNRESAFQLIQKAISDLFDWLLAASKEEITPSIDRKDQVMRQAEISQGTRSMDAGNKAEPDAKDVRVDEKTMIQEDIRHSNDQTKLHSNSDRRVIIKIAGTASLLRETRGTTGSPLCSRDSSHSTARESSSGELDISCLSDGFGQMSLKSHPTPTGVFDQLDRIARPEHNPNPGINNIFRQHGSPPWLPHPLKDLDSAIGLLISLPNWQMDTFPGQDHIAKLVVQMIYVGLLNKLIACASSLYAQLCLQSLDDPFSASEIFFACVGRLSQHYQQLAELNFPFANFLDAAIQRLQVFESFMKPNLAVGRESRGRASMSAMEESLQIYRIKSACGLPFRSYRPLALACYFASDSEEEIGNDSMMQGVEGNVTKGLVSMTVMELLLSN